MSGQDGPKTNVHRDQNENLSRPLVEFVVVVGDVAFCLLFHHLHKHHSNSKHHLDLDGKGFQRHTDGQTLGFPCLVIETPVMLGTFNEVSNHQTLSQQCSTVCAAPRSGIELPIILCVVHNVRLGANIKPKHLSRRDLICLAGRDPAILVRGEGENGLCFRSGDLRWQLEFDVVVWIGALFDECGNHLTVHLPDAIVRLRELRLQDLVQLWQIIVRDHGEGVVLHMILHIPVNKRRDRVDVAGTSVESVVKNILREPSVLENTNEHKMPSPEGIRQKYIQHWGWIAQICCCQHR